ncbi:MAG: hypothetical protein IKJ73_12375 [Lachnospiraceae bacterium]|nr:hypothetical protein [Lachnospiraceae bacterium]
MKFLKNTCVKLSLVGLMALTLTACGNKEEAGKVTEKATTESVVTTEASASTEANATTEANVKTTEASVTTTEANATTTQETTEATDTSKDEATITVDEAINMVKGQMGEDYSYIPEDELEEMNGSQYYVIHVKMLLDSGTMTTMTTYMVKTDGSELFDIYAADYYGEYVRTYDSGETTFVVSEDGTFVMTTSGEVNQVISGYYQVGITDSASVVQLYVYPDKVVTDGEEQVMENVEGTAVIEGDVLTLTMESEPTEYTKR